MPYIDTRELLSQTKFVDSYARYDEDKGRYETWEEAVTRVMDMHRGFYGHLWCDELEELVRHVTDLYKDKRILGSARALQFGGEQLLKHHARLYNCVGSYCDRPEFFGEAFYLLLCGDGAGASMQLHHIGKLPPIKHRTKAPKIHVVEDSIEGWATSADVLMSSFFEGGGKYPEYEGRRVYFDTTQVRPKGSLISGGFRAPGPEPLRAALDKIEYLLQGLTLKHRTFQMRPIHAYDVLMHEADAVLAGGVRRAATNVIFSLFDNEMANAKTGNWQVDNPQRARSNNSAAIVRDEITRERFHELMTKVKEFGEPGFVFVDSTEHMFNPCYEIGFFPQHEGESGWQGCNLAEINGDRCTSKELFWEACRAAAVVGTMQAGYTDFKFISEVSRRIFEREALLGVSITGWMNNPKVLFDSDVLEEGARVVLETNERVAKLLGINPAARATTVKPSGTASLILMTASGIHSEHSPMYIRNVQMNKESDAARLIKQTNPYMVEESTWSAGKTDLVVSFPIIPRKGSIFKEQTMGVEHLKLVALAQKHWVQAGKRPERCVDPTVSHNVSNTTVVDDWDEVEEYIFNNRRFFAGLALISETGDKDYAQAPNTRVIEAKDIVKEYGTGAIFASGLVVEALKAFGNLWTACATAFGMGDDIDTLSEDHDNLLKKDWVRRFENYSKNYFDNDMKRAEYALKNVYILHKWQKIQQTFTEVDFTNAVKRRKYVDVDTMGAVACHGMSCEL